MFRDKIYKNKILVKYIMASYPAPSANLPIFNPTVFSVSETPLTLEEASKLYAKKSGAIFYGAVAMPSLSLGGVSVGNKLNEIDANTAKLTDITYNNNTTTILNDLSVIGDLKIGSVTITEAIVIDFGIRLSDVESTLTRITYEIFGDLTKINSNLIITGNLQLGTITNVENSILNNKQKTTKISYDEENSVTIIGDTLKSSGTLIVGSQNYNASDQFEKLQNISKSGNTLTIDDSIYLTGNLQLLNFVDVNGEMLVHQKRLTDITFDDVSLITEIDNNFEVVGNFKLNTITDVEQKIIDLSNATIPYITYDSVGDELVVTKDTNVNGKLNITENNGTPPSASGGSLTLIHENSRGTSSIVFKSETDVGSDYGYISYKDDWQNSSLEKSLLEIGVRNDAEGTGKIDNIALMPSGFVGINTRTPQTMLDVNGDTNIRGNLQLGSITDVEDAINNAGTPYITYNSGDEELTVTKDMVLLNHDLTCKFMRPIVERSSYGLSQDWTKSFLEFSDGGNHLDARNPDGTGRDLFLNLYAEKDIYLGSPDNNSTTYVKGNLNITEINGTPPSATGGSLTLIHNNPRGNSSIVFTSTANVDDYGYISYKDDVGDNPDNNQSLLEIGIQNDGDGANVDNIALMPSGYVGINTRTPETDLDVNGDTNIRGNLQLGSITDVEDAINNAGGVPSITYNAVTETTTFDGNFVVMPQLTITPEPFAIATQEIYSKHGDVNGVAELKLGNDNGLSKTFANVLKSENGNATFYGNKDGETKFFEYNTLDDRIYIHKDMELTSGNLYIDKIQIEEPIGTPPNGQQGSLTLVHGDAGGTSSIVFRSNRDSGIDYGYISYRDDYEGDVFENRSLLEIGCQDDGVGTNVDNIALMPSGFVGVNTRTPQTTLDVNGEIGCNEIQVNSIPLNSFTNYTFGSNYTFGNWGRGNSIRRNTAQSFQPSTSHALQFTFVDNKTYKCLELGTYEITANVIFRNTSVLRVNPCIGIAINGDTNEPTGVTDVSAPKWDLIPYNQTPFAVSYVRMSEGKVCSLTTKRTHHFINETDEVHINSYIETVTGDTFEDTISSAFYTILSATIQFKYIGNFENIT